MSLGFQAAKSRKRSQFFVADAPSSRKRSQYFKPDESLTDGSPCPVCGTGVMRPRDGRYGPFLGCSLFPECRHTVHLGRESEQVLRRAARATVRVEVDTPDTLRVWSSDGTAEGQAVLRTALSRVTTAACSRSPRADWAAAAASARATATFRLEEHDDLLRQLGSGSVGLHVRPVRSLRLLASACVCLRLLASACVCLRLLASDCV
jgi:ssDNA-binding Zn-finger/Zn-ribbon topoisomerase 1